MKLKFNKLSSIISKLKKMVSFDDQLKEIEELYQSINKQKQELKQLREEYQISKDWNFEYSYLLREVTNSINALIWHKDENFRYLLANPLHCHFFFKLDETMNCLNYVKGMTEADLINECSDGDNQTFINNCETSDKYVYETGKIGHFIEASVLNGKDVLLYLIKMPKFDKNNRFIGLIGIGWNLIPRSKDILTAIKRWKYDNLLTTLCKSDCGFCYVVDPKIRKCEIFNHICYSNNNICKSQKEIVDK